MGVLGEQTAAEPVGRVHAHLRTVTMAAHQRLHGHPLLAPLLQPTVTKDACTAALAALYGFHAGIERHLDGAPARAVLIRRDLETLGLAPGKIATLAVADRLPALTSEAARLGCRYVMVGSYLGGRVIAAHLERRLGLRPETGTAFFSGAAAAVGPLWRDLLEALETRVTTPEQRTAAGAAAVATFEALAAWLDQAAVGPGPAS